MISHLCNENSACYQRLIKSVDEAKSIHGVMTDQNAQHYLICNRM